MADLDERILVFGGDYGIPPRVVYSNREDSRYAERREEIMKGSRRIARQRDDEEHHRHIMRNWEKELIG